jgi:ABC-type transport system substrate-binding protein
MKNGGKYDCVVGFSGGCDSSYTLYLAVKAGLNPLAVNYRNHYDTGTAVKNMNYLTARLGVDFYMITPDEAEVNDLMRSFMKAGLPDIEVPTDIALTKVLYEAADKFGIKYILNGHSYKTEGVTPLEWTYMDAKYIESVHAKYGSVPIKTFPLLKLKDFLKYTVVKRIKRIRPLWYIDYNKAEAKKILSKTGWKWYGGHHLENKLADYYGNYWGRKFGFDFGLIEKAAMVRSGQMSRKEAMKNIDVVPRCKVVKEVEGRLGYSGKRSRKTYKDFKTYKQTFHRLKPLFWVLLKAKMIPATFYSKYV